MENDMGESKVGHQISRGNWTQMQPVHCRNRFDEAIYLNHSGNQCIPQVCWKLACSRPYYSTDKPTQTSVPQLV